MRPAKEASDLRFLVPVAVESVATQLIALVYSALIGGISGSSLAAAATTNTFVNMFTASFSLLTTGSAVLVARRSGAGDTAGASRTMEQAILLTTACAVCIAALLGVFAAPIARLLTSGVDEALLAETALYLRVVMCSFPFLMLYTVEASLLRAAGNSRSCMSATVGMNLVQLLCAWVFLNRLRMGMLGAGLAYVVCRVFGAMFLFRAILRGGRSYHIRLGNLLRPDTRVFRQICRIGAPMGMEQASIQAGYVIANSLAVGLGSTVAAVYSVSNTINGFAGIPQNICLAGATTVVGHRIGARDIVGAKRVSRRIWLLCLSTSVGLGILMAVLGTRVTGLFTHDAATARESARVLWLMVLYQVMAGSINSVDPALKVGGEQRYVMVQTVLGVWAVRLPLTWLFGYVLHWGVMGVMLANIIALMVRAVIGLAKWLPDGWIHETI